MICHSGLSMTRRMFVQSGLAASIATPLLAALQKERLEEAAEVLARATAGGQVAAAVLHVTQREAKFTRAFGKAQSEQAMFLLGSISKPICMTALMTLFEHGDSACCTRGRADQRNGHSDVRRSGGLSTAKHEELRAGAGSLYVGRDGVRANRPRSS